MGVDDDVDVILENCPIPVTTNNICIYQRKIIVIRNLLVYSTIQCSALVIILNDNKCHRTMLRRSRRVLIFLLKKYHNTL